MHEIEQFAGDRAGGFREGDEPVDGLGKLGGAARAVAHLPGDEARIDRARPHDARQRRRQRPRARPLRIGHVEHDEIGRAAEQFRRRGEAADEGGVLGAFKKIAAGIVARMHEHVGAGDALREGAGRRVAFAIGAAIGVRGGGEIGRADGVGVGVAAEQILDAGAIGAGRGAENAIEARFDRPAARRGERIFVVVFVARRDRLHRGIDQRDLRRKEIAEQSGNAPGDVDARAAHGRGRQHFDAGDAAARRLPDRPAAHQRKALRDLLAAGAQAWRCPTDR